MAYQALYRKWRPAVFDDVVGQRHITQTLKSEVISGRVGHAYLFCGGRGTGKTSTARILSRALNCENPQDGNPCNECETCKGILNGDILDVVEIDAASNNGVDNIRDLREEARYNASVSKYKIYIIDEVHMLSTGAFNALLKLLEEPPSHVVFILATTEIHKVLPTILSRCQRFDFRRITSEDILGRLKVVAAGENLEYEDEALGLIAQAADGALRDALSLLDQCSALGGKLTYEGTAALLGVTDESFLRQAAQAAAAGDAPAAMELVDGYVAQGKNLGQFTDCLIQYFRDLLLCKVLNRSGEDKAELAGQFTQEKLIHAIGLLTEAQNSAKYLKDGRALLEIALLKICRPELDAGSESFASRLADLEQKVQRGAVAIQAVVPAEKPKAAQTVKKPKKKLTKEELTQEMRVIKEKWPEIRKTAELESLQVYMALEQARLEQDEGKLVLIFNDNDAIGMEFLKQNMDAFVSIVEKVTGLEAEFLLRKQSYYEELAPPEHDKLEDLEQFLNQLEQGEDIPLPQEDSAPDLPEELPTEGGMEAPPPGDEDIPF